jgi:sugar phosphate isomerase/epimerase
MPGIDLQKVLSRMSYHAVYDNSILEAISFASKNGFSGIQIAIETPHLSFERLDDGDILKIRKASLEQKIRLSLHAADDASLTNSCTEISNGILNYYSKLIDFAVKVGAERITIHSGSPTLFPTDTEPRELFPKIDKAYYKEVFSRNLRKLLEMAKSKVKICIENYGLYGFALEVLQENLAGDLGLKLCWDLEKTYGGGNAADMRIVDFFTKNRAYVDQVHLHSLINSKGHSVIQKGIVDFPYYFDILKDADVQDYCIEVRPREKAVESLENLKKILTET